MARVYDKAWFRALPRDACVIQELLGGNCSGPIAHHHVEPLNLGGADDGRTVPVCASHHPMLEALARRVHGSQQPRTCPHFHATAEGRAACERKLNVAA